jgi:TetR/AcrR family transcriptional regulator, transcriptional repressor for nem operon
MKEKTSNRDTRLTLIEAGIKIMFEKGYTNTGIQDVLALAGVPKGSFYHYFSSKEDFGLQIIDHFDRQYSARLFNLMNNSTMSPAERLIAFCENGKATLLSQECRGGCLIGNLGQEMADQSETLRQALSAVMNHWLGIFSECIAEGQHIGELNQTVSANKLSEQFLSGWNGALMRAKLLKSVEPINSFIEIMFEYVLIPYDGEFVPDSYKKTEELNTMSFVAGDFGVDQISPVFDASV